MDTIYVAKSYQNFNKVGEPFDKDGKSYITIEGKCDKCGGLGRIEYFGHIDSGICYLCGGRGIWHKDVRVYSQKEYEAMERRNQKEAEKKERELEEERKNAKAKWFSSNGFTDDGITYMLVGNTFSIKDELKAMALASELVYDDKNKKITLLGITGTKGKTTSVSFLHNILDEETKIKSMPPIN